MSEWKDDDEVTTTFGSLQLGLSQAHAAGVKTEQERIIKLLASFWCGEPACTKHPVRMDWVIAGIKGEQK